jgi:hypothetical protein
MKRIFLVPVLLVFLFSGCWLNQPSFTGPEELALIASSVKSFSDKEVLAAMSSIEKDEFEGNDSGSPKTIFEETETIVLPDGTVVIITRTLDDKDTTDDTEDDILTVRREFQGFDGLVRVETITRPLKPELDWAGWDGDELVQTANGEVTIEGVTVKTGFIKAYWDKSSGEVVLTTIEKEYTHIDRNGQIVRTIIEIDEDGLLSKTQYRIRVTVDGEIIVHSFEFEEFEDVDGKIYVKIIRDDGNYCIIRSRCNPVIREYYTADGILRMRVTEERTEGTRIIEITREFYDAEGNLIREEHGTIEYRFINGELVIIKTLDDGRSFELIISESEDGFLVNRDGFIYQVVIQGDTIYIYGEDGGLIGHVSFLEDGSVVVTSNGTTEIIDL